MLALYLGLELQSLSLYVVAAFRRDHLRSSEAGLKYFVLGALSSGMLLYGISMIYGFAGTTSFVGLAAQFSTGVPAPIGLIVGIVFLRSEEHTSELQSLMRISYAIFCLTKKNIT